MASSFALGSVAVGNMQKLVPLILEQINTRHDLQYLMLHSLKEVCLRLKSTFSVSFPHMIKLAVCSPSHKTDSEILEYQEYLTVGSLTY